jgi:phosphohistidine phosphatase SixA
MHTQYFAFVAGLAFNFHRVMILGNNPAILNTAKKLMSQHGIEDFPDGGYMEIKWDHQDLWMNVVPGTGTTTVAVSPETADFFDGYYLNATSNKRS